MSAVCATGHLWQQKSPRKLALLKLSCENEGATKVRKLNQEKQTLAKYNKTPSETVDFVLGDAT